MTLKPKKINLTTIAATPIAPDTNKDAIVKMVSSLLHLTEEEKQAVIEYVQIKEMSKGDFLLKEGEAAYLCYQVIKGCVREYYLKDGEEKTTNFFIEGDSISSMNGSGQKKPSKYYLECLEDSTLSTMNEAEEIEMYRRFPKFESLCRVQVEGMLGASQEKLANYMISSPTERYLDLLENRPQLLNRVPQYQLASYIGVQPETLSRIRKKISKG